ncbi:MAG: Maf-like protein [Rubellimicrobium sp.]|nr:Maf-like protein [Rubellimicrobium sp.]
MPDTALFTLASGSTIRAALLGNAGLRFDVAPPTLDEGRARAQYRQAGLDAGELALALARDKAVEVSAGRDGLILGCDQILEVEGDILTKPLDSDDAHAQLARLSGRTHRLLTAAVFVEGGCPLWQHLAEARLTMHPLSSGFIDAYVARTWDRIRHSVGCYQLESEGVRLFREVEGSYFSILGLPLVEVLGFLVETGRATT